MVTAIALIPPAVLATATLSGVFGMGGGMILMGVYASLLPVAAAMILHGVTQLASNGYRAWLFRRHVYGPALVWLAAGGATSLAVMTALAVTVDRAVLFLVLGGLPVVVALLPAGRVPGIESRPAALACGALFIATQLIAGVGGPLLDLFFVKGELDRYQVVGTKAVISTTGHAIKLVYFSWLVPPPGQLGLPLWIYPIAVALALVGTRLGKRLLDRMTDIGFRALSTRLIAAIAILFLARGAAELL
jgi:uncharacterized membrane protein YfcA